MAEIFGAAASAAGLISLSMQLLESTQKLKSFYDTSRDAPDTVARLCSDLETMSLALRQFEQYRQNDIFGGELLGRCIIACEQAVTRIRAAVDKVDRLLRKTRFAGRVYMGFKEPEVRALLEEMEHAKSSMLLAYTSYCQSWNMRESAKHAAALALQSERTEKILDFVSRANNASSSFIDFTNPPVPAIQKTTQQDSSPNRRGMDIDRQCNRHGRRRSYKFRLALPHWLVNCVWEFGVIESSGVWTAQAYPINVRPYHAFAFDFVHSGDVDACRDLIKSGQLSLRDYIDYGYEPRPRSLLQEAALHGHVELCRFLLQEGSFLRRDDILESAYWSFVEYEAGRQLYQRFRTQKQNQRLERNENAMYTLFIEQCEMHVNVELLVEPMVDLPEERYISHLDEVDLDFSRIAFETFLKAQPRAFAKIADLTFAKQFSMVVESTGWPASVFSALLARFPYDCATASTQEGKTALHWAAVYFGEWLWKHHKDNAESYLKLASELISAGANVHACWFDPRFTLPVTTTGSNRRPLITPFGSFIRYFANEKDVYGFQNGSAGRLADAVKLWGQMIVKGGQSLVAYVELENRILAQTPSLVVFNTGEVFPPAELVLLDCATLAVRWTSITLLPIYKAVSVLAPGAWPMRPEPIDTIIWKPSYMDIKDGLRWICIAHLRIKTSSPPLVNSFDDWDHFPPEEVTGMYDDMLSGTQDDHGLALRFEAKGLSADPHRHQTFDHRRSASCPPVEERKRVPEAHVSTRRCYHKCPLDLRWRICYSAHLTWRECMHGHCEAPPPHMKAGWTGRIYLSWEDWLLHDEDHVEKARRFAARFCPDRMSKVEATSARAADRARFAMRRLRGTVGAV